MMVENVRYNLMRTAQELAEKNLHSLALLIVSPSDQGKTETVEIFASRHDGVWLIPPASETKIHEMFRRHRNITTIAIDEPFDWRSDDYVAAAMMCKHILTGKISAPRSNVFTTGVVQRKRTKTGVVIMCNDNQFDKVRRSLFGCGLLERAIVIFTQQTSFEMRDYIRDYYASHDDIKFSAGYQFCMRDVLPEEKKFIDKLFVGHQRDSVMWIAKITPEDIFAELKPYLASEFNNEFVEEKISFEE